MLNTSNVDPLPLSGREQTGVLGGTATHWALLGFSVEIRAVLGGIGGNSCISDLDGSLLGFKIGNWSAYFDGRY